VSVKSRRANAAARRPGRNAANAENYEIIENI
jgi:hypothetical protein